MCVCVVCVCVWCVCVCDVCVCGVCVCDVCVCVCFLLNGKAPAQPSARRSTRIAAYKR